MTQRLRGDFKAIAALRTCKAIARRIRRDFKPLRSASTAIAVRLAFAKGSQRIAYDRKAIAKRRFEAIAKIGRRDAKRL
jgi:hypothetical protein